MCFGIVGDTRCESLYFGMFRESRGHPNAFSGFSGGFENWFWKIDSVGGFGFVSFAF